MSARVNLPPKATSRPFKVGDLICTINSEADTFNVVLLTGKVAGTDDFYYQQWTQAGRVEKPNINPYSFHQSLWELFEGELILKN